MPQYVIERPYTSFIPQQRTHAKQVVEAAKAILKSFEFRVSFTDKFNPVLHAFQGAFNNMKEHSSSRSEFNATPRKNYSRNVNDSNFHFNDR